MTTTDSTVSLRLTVSRAAAAARDGRLDQAARLLDGLDDRAVAHATVLDLRARIHAQSGDLDAADRCWARVLNAAPDHAAARTGRATVSRIAQGRMPFRPRVQPHPVVATVGAIAVAVAAVAGSWVLTGDRSPEGRTVSAGLESETRRADDLRQQLAARDAARAAAASQQGHDLDAITAAMTLSGVVPHRRADDVELVFDAGVYESDTRITTSAANLLTEIGLRAAGLPVAITVVGHTVAVAGGPQTGGSTVAWERAVVAAAYLAEGGGLPLTTFTLTSADQRDARYPDPARNRTVTILLRPTR